MNRNESSGEALTALQHASERINTGEIPSTDTGPRSCTATSGLLRSLSEYKQEYNIKSKLHKYDLDRAVIINKNKTDVSNYVNIPLN